MTQTSSGTLTLPPFIADAFSVQRTLGAQIDFSLVSASREGAAGKKEVPGGTVMGRLQTGKIVPRADFSLAAAIAVVGTTGTATVAAGHGLLTGQEVVISDGNASIDGRHTITVTSSTEFTFPLPAGGSGDGSTTVRLPATEILVSSATEGELQAAKSGYGTLRGGMLFDNLLPDATGSPKKLPAAVKAELAESNTYFSYVQYEDSRTA